MSFKIKHLLSILLLLLLWATSAWGINLSAVYLTACQRDIGVIVDVNESNVQLLTLEGDVKEIPRFNIIYIASYPLGFTPIRGITAREELDFVTIKTLYDDQVVDLVRGWMIDYSEEQISFLTLEGDETVIDVADIWDIEIGPLTEAPEFQSRPALQYDFHHPYPFVHCQKEAAAGASSLRKVYPQYLLGDPLLIKKELDRLQEGHERIEDYYKNKVYYPVPQLYGNNTYLGLWLNAGNRYGSSRSRSNSFIPMLRSELSEGPFGFQRIWVTGSAPMPYSIQEEPQTQLYYRMKADYFHFSFMYDINRMIISETKYKWKLEDLDAHDHRLNEIFHVGFGFDWNKVALEYNLTRAQYGVRHNELFFFSRANIHKFGFFYHTRNFKLDFYHGFAADRKPSIEEVSEGQTEQDIQEAEEFLAGIPEFSGNFRIYRLNLEFFSWEDYSFLYSAIYRKLKFHRNPEVDGVEELRYNSEGVTNAIYLNYALPSDLTLYGYFSYEQRSQRYGSVRWDGKSKDSFPKGGIGISLKI